jgi:hypothetical protein
MALSEDSYETHSIDEMQYALEITTKIKATLACPEQIEQRHYRYFAEKKQPLAYFVKARWGNETNGMQVSISDELRPDIANELLEAIASVWTV